MPSFSSRSRDARIARALESVLKDYTITEHPLGPGGLRRFQLSNGRSTPSLVIADATWEAPPICTCPDVKRSAWCKHIIAVLYRESELRGQLLDLFLG